MKKRNITTAAFLAGVTTLAVSLPAMAQSGDTVAAPFLDVSVSLQKDAGPAIDGDLAFMVTPVGKDA